MSLDPEAAIPKARTATTSHRRVACNVVVDRALALGVTASPGRLYVIGEPEHPNLRLSFAAIDVLSIDEAVRRLAKAIAEGT